MQKVLRRNGNQEREGCKKKKESHFFVLSKLNFTLFEQWPPQLCHVPHSFRVSLRPGLSSDFLGGRFSQARVGQISTPQCPTPMGAVGKGWEHVVQSWLTGHMPVCKEAVLREERRPHKCPPEELRP